MAVTQYIGARYVPLFAEPIEWSNEREYEPLTIVVHSGNSYTSRQAVPIGIDIADEKFWALTGNYNAQVEQYRAETQRAAQTANTAKDTADSAATAAQELNRELAAEVEARAAEDTAIREDFAEEVEARAAEDTAIREDFAEEVASLNATISADVDRLEIQDEAIREQALTAAKTGINYWGIGKQEGTSEVLLYASEDGKNWQYYRKYDELSYHDAYSVIRIGKFWYCTGSKYYDVSEDLSGSWSARNEYGGSQYLDALDPYDKIWVSQIFYDKNTDSYRMTCAIQYRADTVALNGVGGTTSPYMRIYAFPIEQNEATGALTITGAGVLLINVADSSYIDPTIVYTNRFGYIMICKNEITSKLEMWRGSSLSNMTKQNFNCPLTGIEGPKIICPEDETFMSVFYSAYSPRTVSALEDSVNYNNAPNTLPHHNGFAWVSDENGLLGDFLPDTITGIFPIRHFGVAICDAETAAQIAKLSPIRTIRSLDTIPFNTFTFTPENQALIVLTNYPTGTIWGIGGVAPSALLRYKRMFRNPSTINILWATNYISNSNITIGDGFRANASETAKLRTTGKCEGSNYFVYTDNLFLEKEP